MLLIRSKTLCTAILIAVFALFASLPVEAVISAKDVDNIYKVPLWYREQKVDDFICEEFGIEAPAADLDEWRDIIHRATESTDPVRIALVGKYIQLEDAYKSVSEALLHSGWWHGGRVEIDWVDSETLVDDDSAEARLAVFMRAKNSGQLIAKLPAAAQAEWGVAVQMAQALRRQKKDEEAWKILLAEPVTTITVKPDGWWAERRASAYAALKAGKPVITGNKELLAKAGAELFQAAESAGVDLLFEAAVAGGIPIIRPLRESLVGERINRVMGIVNGTTNYILTRMTEAGASYADALSEAQALGYAEADPTADVEGYDAGAKAAIIASIAFGVGVTADDVQHEGISGITETDIAFAKRMGFVIKLLAVAEQDAAGEISVRVHPAMVPVEHPLAAVRESFNAVFVEGAAVAVAVVGDRELPVARRVRLGTEPTQALLGHEGRLGHADHIDVIGHQSRVRGVRQGAVRVDAVVPHGPGERVVRRPPVVGGEGDGAARR